MWWFLLWASLRPAYADDAMAQRLADLRREVEQLHDEVSTEQEAIRSRARGLEAERADLEAQIRRETLRIEQLERIAAEERAALEAGGAQGDVLVPVVTDGLGKIEASIREGLPYRTAERVAAVQELRASLTAGNVRPEQAAIRTWQLIEDELRLTRENALDRQVIPLDGKDVLVEVGRIGMVALTWRAEDGRVGHAVRDGAGWRFAELTAPDDVARVLDLHDALLKQIRTGWFELPGATVGVR